MRITLALSVIACFLAAGCGQSAPDASADAMTPSAAAPVAADAPPASAGPPPGAAEATSPPSPVPIDSGTVTLTPENSKIEFVGLHLPPRQPDPRTGGFERFTGKIELDPAAKAPRSIVAEFDTTSLWTEIQRLTDHLKSADFFEVNEFPTAKFQSTRVEPLQGDGQHLVTGNLTLHGVTKEISFPATIEVTDQGMTLRSQFSINRTDFGLNYGPEMIENQIAVTVVVGEKTQPRQGGGVSNGGRGAGRKGKFDPAQFFARQDNDQDGKLTGDEIPQPMRDNLAAIDTDGDGAISLAEYQERMRQFRASRGAKPPADK